MTVFEELQIINPFHATALIVYLLKRENLYFFIFQGVYEEGDQ